MDFRCWAGGADKGEATVPGVPGEAAQGLGGAAAPQLRLRELQRAAPQLCIPPGMPSCVPFSSSPYFPSPLASSGGCFHRNASKAHI